MARHHGRGAGAAAASLFFATGLGLALAGRPLRGFAWLGAAAIAAMLTLITPWCSWLIVAAHFSWSERSVSRYHEVLGDHPHDLFSSAGRGDPDYHPVRDFPIRGNPLPSCANAMDVENVKQTLGTVVETKPETAAACEPQVHYVVPPDHVFVLGDNRDNSNDSRIWAASRSPTSRAS